MEEDWPTRFTREAFERIDAFMADHPEYTREGVEQPGQGSTNRVAFARRDGELVVFKVFCEEERKQRECFASRHWSGTGLVPRLIWDDDPRMMIMAHIPGNYLGAIRDSDRDAWLDCCREVGKASATLTCVPLTAATREEFESRFYEFGPLEAYLKRILELGRGVQACDPDFRDDFWRVSLDFIEEQLPSIFSEPRCLYHQDAGNLHVANGRFMGFFDLEMCRVGCPAMQLASSGMFSDVSAWERFREGWESVAGKLTGGQMRAACAGQHLLGWREITRYMSYDGTPGTGYSWADPADPARYRSGIECVNRVLGVIM